MARPRICELVRYHMVDVTLHGAWSGPASLELHPHALAPVADLPVREVVSAMHFIADMTLALGTRGARLSERAAVRRPARNAPITPRRARVP